MAKEFTLLMLATLLCQTVGQNTLSQEEMRQLTGRKDFSLTHLNPHECQYVNLTRSQTVQLGCPSLKPRDVCGNAPLVFSRCCPGFRRFVGLDGNSTCSERVLPAGRLTDSVPELKSEVASIVNFTRRFVQTWQVGVTLRRGGPWTVLAVADPAFDDVSLDGFESLGSCGNPANDSLVSANFSTKAKEGSDEHRARIYNKNMCKSRNFTQEAWKLILPGRIPIMPSEVTEESATSALRLANGGRYPVKILTYANGITCIECAPVVEANHESADGLVHILGKNILSGETPQSLSSLLSSKHPEFWSLIDSDTRDSLSCNQSSYTALIPKNASNLTPELARKHLLPGLWCSAAMLATEKARPVPTMAGDSVQLKCNGGVKSVQFGDSDTVELDENNMDIMAVDGVVHQLKGELGLHRGQPFESVRQHDSANSESSGMSMNLLAECRLHFSQEFGHLILAPTDAALERFLSSHSSVPEALHFRSSRSTRCELLAHHVLLTQPNAADLQLAGQWQTVYRDFRNQTVAGFLLRNREQIRATFMGSVVIGNGRPIRRGRVYDIDDVIIPMGSPVWTNMMDKFYADQSELIARFNDAAGSAGALGTLFLPQRGHATLRKTSTLMSHISSTVFYLNHLPGEPQSIALSTLQGGQLTVTRHLGQFWAKLDGGHARSRILHCGVRVQNGTICSIEQPLTDFEEFEELKDFKDFGGSPGT